MRHKLFPKEIIENSQEKNFSTHSVKSKIIYSTIVASLIGLLGIMPFIKVDVGIRSQGLIRPVTEVIQISSPVSGQIRTLNATENSYVLKNEIIATVDGSAIEEKLRFIRSRRDQLSLFIIDLNELQQHRTDLINSEIELQTVRFQRSLLEFKQQLINQQQIIDQEKRLLERSAMLFERKAISISEFEERQHSFQNEKNRYKLLLEQQYNRWNLDKLTFQNEADELASEFSQLSNELTHYDIRSPVSGTLQNSTGISVNSFIYANQVVGEISPDTNLIAEVYVTPKDVGLLKEGMPVRFQIDAYNQNHWGVVSGNIESISTDMLFNDNNPIFKIRCSVDNLYLELKNGFKGEIKKGMTFQARFIVSRRSLFQLLFDKVDDWLNPAWAENNYASNHTNP